MAITKEQAVDILDKFDFFQGQRAGRELWAGKPFDVQEQDISNFSRDVALLKEYINSADVAPRSEVDKWQEINKQLHKEMSERMIEERKIERKLAVRQIIGEILSNHTPDIDGFFTMHETELAELKKKYTEEKG